MGLRRVFGRSPAARASTSAPTAARVVRRQFRSLARERTSAFDPCGALEHDAVALYEVEFPVSPPASGDSSVQAPVGIDLETDFYGNHAVVKHVSSSSPAFSLSRCYIRPGHIVVAVNGADLSQASFQQVVQAVRTARAPRVIRFLDPEVLSLDELSHEPVLANRDEYGFAKDEQHILNHRRRLRQRQRSDYQNELDWTTFISRWGGLDRIEALLHQPTDSEASDEHSTTLQGGEVSSLSTLQLELRELVMRGVPAMLRAQVWAVLANVSGYRSRYSADHFAQLTHKMLPAATLDDIEKDVARTYPEHAYFRSERGQGELRTLLVAYALHNPEIGYCQAMNFIAGMLLLLADVERAFWLLCVLLQDDDRTSGCSKRRLLPAANYSRSMVGTQTDQLVFRSLVRLELPAISAFSDKHGLHIELFTLHWFLCVFVCTLPTASALRVWDWLFLDGQEVLFTTAIGVLKLEEPRILGASGVSELHAVIKALGTDLHDDDELMAYLRGISASTRGGSGTFDAVADQSQGGQARNIESDAALKVSASRRRSRLFQTRRQSVAAAPAFTKKHTLEDIEQLRRNFRKKLLNASFSSLQASM